MAVLLAHGNWGCPLSTSPSITQSAKGRAGALSLPSSTPQQHSRCTVSRAQMQEQGSSCPSPVPIRMPQDCATAEPTAAVRWTEAGAWNARYQRGTGGRLLTLQSRVPLTGFKTRQGPARPTATSPCSEFRRARMDLLLYASPTTVGSLGQVYTWTGGYFWVMT